MKPTARLRLFLLGSTLLAAPAVQAFTYYWDTNNNTAGFGTAGGTWAAPTTNSATQGWTQNTGGTVALSGTTTTATTDSINFGNGATGLAAGTITVSGTVDAGDITFASGSGVITLSGGAINLAAASNIAVNNSYDIIRSNLSGASTSLTKAGTGALWLYGANSYTGATNINAGTIIARNGSALGTGSGANVSVATNTGLTYNAASDTQLAIGGNLSITGGATTLIGASIGTTATSAAINVAGDATTDVAAVKVNLYGVNGVTHGTGTMTLVTAAGGGSTLNNATYTLGNVYNNTDFTVGALSATATDLTVATSAATALSSAFWKGGLSGATNVWAVSNGSTQSNWVTTSGGTNQALVPGATTDVYFSNSTVTTAPTATVLGSDMSIKSLTQTYNAGAVTLNSDGYSLTIGSGGITKNAGTGVATLASPLILGSAQTWTNKAFDSDVKTAAGSLVVGTATDGINNGGFLLTFDGIGTTQFKGSITGVGGLTKNGSGTLILGANPNPGQFYTGTTTINGGVVRTGGGNNGTGTGNLTINGGYLESYFGSTFTRSLGSGVGEVQILGGISGFSEQGSSATYTFNNSAAFEVVWGAANEASNVLSTGFFNPSTLVLQGDTVNAGKTITVANKLDLNATTRSIYVGQGSTTAATLSNVIRTSSGTAGLTKTGIGNLILSNANTYNGATTINAGSITFSGSGTANNSNALNLGGGTLRLINTAQVNRFTDGSAITATRGGSISYENTSGANVYTETLGSLAANGGQTNIVLLNNQTGAGSQTLTFGTSGTSNLTQSGTGSATFSATTTGPQITLNKNMIVVFGSGTTTAGQIIGPWATTGTAANAQTDYAVYDGNYVRGAGITSSAQSAWSTDNTSGTGTLNNTLANASGSAADGRLGADRNINSLRNTTAAGGAITVNQTSDYITLAGKSFANGDVIVFGTSGGNLTAGVPYFIRDYNGDSANGFKVALTHSGAAIDINGANIGTVTAGITLGASDLGTYGILNGSATPLVIGGNGGHVSLPTSGNGNLQLTTGLGGIVISAPIADPTGSGSLTLVKNGSAANLVLNGVNTFTGGIAINAGTLQIGTNGTANGANLNSGNYAGNIFIAAGANLDFQTNSNQTLSGVISGDGNLLKRYIGTLTLGDDNTYTGKTTIGAITNAGDPTLVVSSFNSVNGGTPLLANSSLGAPTTIANGTIEMGSNNSSPNPTLKYAGVAATGETTDRVINFIFNGTATRTLDASNPSGLLKFTSAFTSNGTATGHLALRGTGNAEITQGLPFSFANLTKSDGGTWTLGGAVGSTGLLTVSGGTLALQKTVSLHGGNAANWTAAKINVKSGATLALNVDSVGAAGFSTDDLNTLLGNISTGVTSAVLGLQGGSRIGLDTSTATGGTFTQGNAIANSTGSGGFNGTVGLTKLGTGILVLDKTNTYTGTTTVSAGTLIINGSTSSTSLVTVASSATLGGTGTVGGATTISGIHSPGNSPGIQTFGSDLTYSGVSPSPVVNWELVGNTATNAANPNAVFDQIIVGGDLDFADATTLNLSFIAAGSTVLWSDTFWGASQSWTLYDVTGTTSNFINLSLNTTNWLDGFGNYFNTVRTGSSFSLSQSGDDVLINYNFVPIPEPRAALLGGLGLLMLLRRRRY